MTATFPGLPNAPRRRYAAEMLLLARDLCAVLADVAGGICRIDTRIAASAMGAEFERLGSDGDGSEPKSCSQSVPSHAPPPPSSPRVPASSDAPTSLSGTRVLLVEESEVQQWMVTAALQKAGAEVWSFADAPSALNHLAAPNDPTGQWPDIAIISVELPGLSGLDLIRHLRAGDGRCSGLAVLAFTAHAGAAAQTEILAAGADGILPKPLRDPLDLIAALSGLHLPAAPPNETPPHETPPQPTPPLGLDLALLNHLLDLAGPDMAATLLNRFCIDLGQTAADLTAGPEDWPRLRQAAHNLISLAGTAGEAGLAAQAQQLNTLARQQDDAGIARIKPALLADLQTLITYLAARARCCQMGPHQP